MSEKTKRVTRSASAESQRTADQQRYPLNSTSNPNFLEPSTPAQQPRTLSQELDNQLITETSNNEFYLDESMSSFEMSTPRTSEDEYSSQEQVTQKVKELTKKVDTYDTEFTKNPDWTTNIIQEHEKIDKEIKEFLRKLAMINDGSEFIEGVITGMSKLITHATNIKKVHFKKYMAMCNQNQLGGASA